MAQKPFLQRILDSRETASSRRFITLIIAAHFVIASFAILFLVCYMTVVLPKGRVDNNLLLVLEKILEYDFYIILSGFGIITSEGLVSIIMKRTYNEQPPPMDPPDEPILNPDGTYNSH